MFSPPHRPNGRTAGVALALLLGVGLLAGGAAGASDTSIDHDGANLTLEAGPNQTVTGETGLDPGTTVQVRVVSTDDANPYLFAGETTVAEDGTFAATLDLSDVPPNTTFNASVYGNDRTLAETAGVLEPCRDGCAVEAPEPADEGFRYDGGNLTLAAGERQVVAGNADLPAGTTVRVRLRSTDGANPFLRSSPATVRANGTFAAVFDLSTVEGGTGMEAVAHYDGETIASADGRVVACEGDCTDPVPGYAGEADLDGPENEAWNGTGVSLRTETVVQQGDAVEIPLSVEGVETIRLTVGSERLGYELAAAVRDDGNGAATVVFHTERAGTDGAALTARGDDAVSVTRDTPLPSTIDPEIYPVELVYPNGTVADSAVLNVTDDGERDRRYDDDGWVGESFGFRESIATGRRVIDVGVGFGDASEALLTVESDGYAANLAVEDGDGNDTAVVEIHTDADGPTFVARDPADSVTVLNTTGGELAPGTYDLSLRGDEGVVDIATLSVQAGPNRTNGTDGATANPPARRRPNDTGAIPGPLDGVAALAVGALLAVGGIGLLTSRRF